ncbi:hypothetical protein [Paenibacillus ottowii]|uniref:Uncharacterized protein n=1 Tax=Paenibacillus ottowii TaxID=2315729 RepID=A0ABY3BB69_9BACL|nr:hypothetical protein [Paenibacillus ottowii]TQS01389.1 hypothetical protein FKV70_03385 [Paenibacillus ottowii]TQS01444.1 hypothetical protein FKV70_03675 [Paenibacillus ottowii]
MEKKKAEYRSNGLIHVPDIRIEYKGFIIQPKLDMGRNPWRIKGNDIRRGYIVMENGCLAMPGGAWACSVVEAKHMIDTYLESGGDVQKFWELLRKAEYEEYDEV